VLHILVYTLLPGNAADNLRVVWGEIMVLAKRNKKNTYTNMRLNMFTEPLTPHKKHPKLKGRAAEVRGLVYSLVHVFDKYKDPTNLQHVQIMICLKKSCTLEQMLEDHRGDYAIPREYADEFEAVGLDFLVVYGALAKYYTDRGRKLFNLTIKAHYLAHAILNARFISPRMAWTYMGEDFMRVSRRLLAVCCAGNKPEQATVKFAMHYRVGMNQVFGSY